MYIKIDPKNSQAWPTDTSAPKPENIKIPSNLVERTPSGNKKQKRPKTLDEMNAHLKKVEFNIPKGQFLPNPPRLAPQL